MALPSAESAASLLREPAPRLSPPPAAPPVSTEVLPSPAAEPAPSARGLRFHGSGSTLFGIYIVNALLILLTLGVYYFWGKTRVRRFVFGQPEFEGDGFFYRGIGLELLLGLGR